MVASGYRPAMTSGGKEGGLEASALRRINEWAAENAQIKRMDEELSLDNQALHCGQTLDSTQRGWGVSHSPEKWTECAPPSLVSCGPSQADF